ncbi:MULTISPECIES: hypothetical protein [unclassified Bradyrhizobium]|uniref:hypothetical protein n=1 Tax=unclassified Bradyrhizobium TaxID=2631580 RepID=UPI00339A108C
MVSMALLHVDDRRAGETNPAAGHRRMAAHPLAHVERSGADLHRGGRRPVALLLA